MVVERVLASHSAGGKCPKQRLFVIRGKCKINKLAKARKIRKSPGTLGLKKFGTGKLWVKKV